jgi:myo-inositol-1(or 4)-monophosphatase
MKDISSMKDIAVKAAKAAGELLRNNMGRIASLHIDRKKKFDFVTDIDIESERLIIDIIKSQFPKHAILSEESRREPAKGYRWIIDPLDGTTNYIHGYPVFAVSIALEHKDEIILGVIYNPLLDELFCAQKGSGAFLNGRAIHVSGVSELKDSLLATGFPFRSKEYLDIYLTAFASIFRQVSGIRRAGSAALDFAHLACGRCDGFWEIGLSPWDIAAGSLLIEEAGGFITDFNGGPKHIWTGNVLAGNQFVHGEVLKVIKEVFRGSPVLGV